MRFSPGCQCCGPPTTVVVPPCCSSQPLPRTLYLTLGNGGGFGTDCGSSACFVGTWELTWSDANSRWESAPLDCTSGVLGTTVHFYFFCDGVNAFTLQIVGDGNCVGSDSSSNSILETSCDPFSWAVPLSRSRLISVNCSAPFSCKYTASVSE